MKTLRSLVLGTAFAASTSLTAVAPATAAPSPSVAINTSIAINNAALAAQAANLSAQAAALQAQNAPPPQTSGEKALAAGLLGLTATIGVGAIGLVISDMTGLSDKLGDWKRKRHNRRHGY